MRSRHTTHLSLTRARAAPWPVRQRVRVPFFCALRRGEMLEQRWRECVSVRHALYHTFRLTHDACHARLEHALYSAFCAFLAVARLTPFSAYLGACHTGIHNPQEDRRHRQVCAPGPGASSTHILLSTLVTTCSSVHSYRRQEAALRASASGRPLPSPLGPPRSRLQPRALRASPRCPAPRACPPAARAPRPRRAPTPEGTCTPHMQPPHARPARW